MAEVQDAPAWPGDQHLDRDDWAAIEQLRAELPASGPGRSDGKAAIRRIRRAASDRYYTERVRLDTSGESAGDHGVVGAGTYIRWPWRALDELTGGMAPGGRPIYVVGFSNIGKTTFIRSCILGWAAQGIGVDVLPLETTAERFAMGLASTIAGVDPGLIASGDYLRQADGEARKAALEAAGRRCRANLLWEPHSVAALANPVRVHNLPRLDVAGLRRACGEAVDRGAKIVVVDHVDHVQSGGKSSFDISRDVNNAALDIAREMGLLMVCLSQANNEALKGNTDHLARYAPLRESSVWMGQLKMQNASIMLGLYRALRHPHPDESQEQYIAALKSARKGDLPASEVLLPRSVGLSTMKNENYGARVGQKALLGWRAGEIVDYEALPYSLR